MSRRVFGVLILTAVLFLNHPDPLRAEAPMPDLTRYPVLYARAEDPGAPDGIVQIIMVGDTSLARGVENMTGTYDMDYPLSAVSPWLKSADLAVGNYEGVIATDDVGIERPLGYRLHAQPGAAPALARAGFGLMNLANNHTMDLGPDGLKATLDYLHSSGIQTVGAGPSGRVARSAVVLNIRGVRVGFLSFTTVPDPPDWGRDREDSWTRAWIDPALGPDLTKAYVRQAAQIADVLIVQFHWGNEYVPCPTEWQLVLGKSAIDTGAALVVGHHPHIVQPFETYGNGFIAYSLGNFLFDQPREPGMALWIRLDKKGVIDVHGLTLKPGTHSTWNPPSQTLDELHSLCNLEKARRP